MATSQEHPQSVFWYAETKSIITVQKKKNYRREYGGDAPDGKTIKAWCEKFLATARVQKESGVSYRRATEKKKEEIRAGFERSSRKSIRQSSRQFNMPTTTVHRLLQRRSVCTLTR